LRERRHDILPLAHHLLDRLSARHGIAPAELAPAAAARLERHSWPGNVRELRNALERALVVRAGGSIHPEDLALDPVPAIGTPHPGAVPLDREAWERASLREALRESGGNRAKAAAMLGISERALYYRMKKLGSL
jgi:DNA-binding NtrC family response regulator